MVLEFSELERLKKDFEVFKNERLKKYGARKGEMEIDIYLPFYSNPGLPAEDLKKFVVSLEGFKTVEKEILAILKQRALMERKGLVKGRKDLADLVGLFRLPNFDWKKYKETISAYGLEKSVRATVGILQSTTKIDELNLNVHQMARFKRRILPFFKV